MNNVHLRFLRHWADAHDFRDKPKSAMYPEAFRLEAARVALEALKEDATVAECAATLGIAKETMSKWITQALNAP